jgi:hypothetical protein
MRGKETQRVPAFYFRGANPQKAIKKLILGLKKGFEYSHISLPCGGVLTNLKIVRSQKWILVGSLCMVALLTASCVNFGANYKYDNLSVLKLGELDSRNYVAQLGKPYSTRTETTKDGKYEFVTYFFAQPRMGKLCFRSMDLEFKDGKLNAYKYVSSYEEDQTGLDDSKIDVIRKGIDKLTRADVLSLAGKPDGEARCPSKMSDFKSRCDKANEVWVWTAANKLHFFGHEKGKLNTRSAYVLFGDGGKVSDVQTEESSDSISLPGQ